MHDEVESQTVWKNSKLSVQAGEVYQASAMRHGDIGNKCIGVDCFRHALPGTCLMLPRTGVLLWVLPLFTSSVPVTS